MTNGSGLDTYLTNKVGAMAAAARQIQIRRRGARNHRR